MYDQISLFSLESTEESETESRQNEPIDSDAARIKELINRRRRQILVNSSVYYRFNSSLISDQQFDAWSRELVQLQTEYPELASECVYQELYLNFEGSTGFDLSNNPWAISKAQYLLKGAVLK